MITITSSMEWVYHDRGSVGPSLVRKFEKVCFDHLKGKRTESEFIYELNTRWLTNGKQVVLFDTKDPVEIFRRMKEIFRHTNFDIELSMREDEKISELSVA